MRDRSDDRQPPGAAAVTGPDAGRLLEAVLGAVGADLRDWHVRSVHRRGSTSVAVVYRVQFTDRDGHARDRLFVAHVSTREVPTGAATLDVDGAVVHVWQFPHDPYLPALAGAVNRTTARAMLERLGLPVEDDPVAIRTRSYRPTRRAVVEVRPTTGAPPAAYVKVLGGRDRARRRRRARALVDSHTALADAGVPVPAVLEADVDVGRVALAALGGRTLRQLLRGDDPLPAPADVADLVRTFHATPPLDAGGDPDGFADVARHVALLTRELPALADDLRHLGEVAAAVGGPRATVHGDLHDGQLLVTDGAVTGVLDVDGAGTGFVANDVGRLLAHVEASALAVPEAAARVEAWADELRAAMADLAPPTDVARAAAGAWVGLATGPLRVASPAWEAESAARIERAVAWADRSG